MANKSKIIMAWSKCRISLAPMPDDESMAADATLADVGVIRNNTTRLEASEGDALQAVETGGAIVAEEKNEGTFTLTTEVIEPSDDLYVTLGIGRKDGDDLLVDTHVVPGNFGVKLRPKNLGAKGIAAPKCSISVAPAFGDDTGHALTLTMTIQQGEAGYWYKKFLYRGDLQVDKTKIDLAATDSASSPTQTVTATTDADAVTAASNAPWCVAQASGKTVKIGAQANEGEARTASVTITAGKDKALVTVTQSAAQG